MTVPPPQLGPFVLHEILGQGAMGVVWRGVHVAQKVPVAVKVLSKQKHWQPQHLDSVRLEVEAMARLHHAGIALVFDYGLVDRRAAKHPTANLPEGTPYFAMELAEHGSLDLYLGKRMGWRTLKSVLTSVLESLAHAHARGVIHRDIKPANVLVTGHYKNLPLLQLTDFGVAHTQSDLRREGSEEDTVGTPNYMAPEQFKGHWREYGPWTDLYALGCMAYELATGDVPFQASSFIEHAYKHIRTEPAPLPAHPGHPASLRDWVARLLAKDPAHRFLRAADALWALEQLDYDFHPLEEGTSLVEMIEEGVVSQDQDVDPMDETLACDTSKIWQAHGRIATHDFETPHGEDTGHFAHDTGSESPEWMGLYASKGSLRQALRGACQDVPPMPDTWRYEVQAPYSMRLVGAGLGLYGLRTVPLVGREDERDRIWDTLRDVGRKSEMATVLLRGPSGVGKSRLAQWICQRSHEVGAAAVLKATHSPAGSPADGLPRMIARHLQCQGLDREDLLEHLRRRLGGVDEIEQEVLALAELVLPSTPKERAEGRGMRFTSPSQWHALIGRLLRHETHQRPVMLWLDDIQWGSDALALCNYLMNEFSGLPVMVLLTARDEALAERPLEQEAVEQVLAHPRSQTCALAPLDQKERARLVEELLCLEGDLASRVEERTGGNPLFAVQLVGDWVQRGVLEVGATGFVLRPGEEGVLPDDIHQITAQHMDLALRDQPPTARTALEIAAALGQEIDYAQWHAACAQAGLPAHEALPEVLAQHGISETLGQSWAFRHGVMRESLERRARESGQWAAHNLACAQMLEHKPDLARRGWAQSLGRHFQEAQAPERALPYLRLAATEYTQTGAYGQALTSLDQHDKTVFSLGLGAADQTMGLSCVLRAEVLAQQGRLPESRALAEHLERQARRKSWDQVHPQVLRLLGDVACIQGHMKKAQDLYQEALHLYTQHKDHEAQAQLLTGMGDVARQCGALAHAESYYQKSLVLSQAMNSVLRRAHNKMGLGLVAYQRGDLDEAQMRLGQAEALFLKQSESASAIDCGLGMADVARQHGDLHRAHKLLKKASAVYNRIGSGQANHAMLGRAQLFIAQGKWSKAHKLLLRCVSNFEDSGERDDVGRASAALLSCVAQQGLWEQWPAHLERAATCLHDTTRADRDVAQVIQLAASLCLSHRRQREAIQAAKLAVSQWERLGLPEEGQALHILLES